MKYFRLLVLALLSVAIIGFNACSKKNTITDPIDTTLYEVTFTLNGGGYTNQTFTFNSSGGAIYSSQYNVTNISFTGENNQSLQIMMKGNSTGTYSFGSTDYSCSITTKDKPLFILTSGTLKITEFGSLLGNVKGTFSGSGVNTSAATITVTNGSFSCKRLS